VIRREIAEIEDEKSRLTKSVKPTIDLTLAEQVDQAMSLMEHLEAILSNPDARAE
jgi:hypothetical protein